ncbi:MAG: hypothetical protein MJE68_18500, partial [Proteobacteria bacterium]|nr:hypothetical protein [Pseudomonadota bacterium]
PTRFYLSFLGLQLVSRMRNHEGAGSSCTITRSPHDLRVKFKMASNVLSEEPCRKHAAIESLFEQLVDGIKTEIRDSTEKFLERGAINQEQKENVMKISNQRHLEADYAASLLFRAVLTNVEDDDRHFDRLLLALRDLEMDQLADDLLKASVVVHSQTSNAHQQMDDNGGASHSTSGTDTPLKKTNEDLSLYDSGIAPPSFSVSGSVPQDSQVYAHHDMPKLVTNQVPLVSPSSEPPQHNQSVEEIPALSQATVLLEPAEDFATSEFGSVGHFQSQPIPHEPDTSYEDGHPDHPPPIQVEDDSNAMLLVPPGGCYAAVKDEVGGTSEELVDQLTEKLKALHLELKNKEMELQARVQEKKQNSELLARIKELEDKVKQMEDEIRVQKLRTDKVATEKDKEINSWKKCYEEKEREVEMLRAKIARQEKEKRELIRDHMAKIKDLVVQQKESARLVREYEVKMEYLDAALNQAIKEKEAAEQQLKEAESKMELAEVQQLQAMFNLMKELRSMDKEWVVLKDANHKLEKEIMRLKLDNQQLVIITKEQKAIIHQRDKELAEEKQAAAEARHDTCAHELNSERRQSMQLQNENAQLKRQLSELQERMSAAESLAKRSKTD